MGIAEHRDVSSVLKFEMARRPQKRELEEDQQDPEYVEKRQRNNRAVQKSRLKAKETNERVDHLKKENEQLEGKIKLLPKELAVLKEVFITHAGTSHGMTVQDLDVEALLSTETNDNEEATTSTEQGQTSG